MNWISCIADWPEIEEVVLVTDGETVNLALLVNIQDSSSKPKIEWCSTPDLTLLDNELPITHWMPLPNPPKEKRDD